PTQGTAIGEAIELCQKSFKAGDKKFKTVILITDGENHEDDPVPIAKSAAETGTVIHTVGMGSNEGTPIPIYQNGNREFLTDNQGQTVLTRLDETTLQSIAAETKGIYVRPAQGDDEMKALIDKIGKMEKRDFGSKQYTDYEDRFQYFLGIAIILLMIESVTGERKSFWIRKLKLFETNEKQSV
ncbi:MAG: VWA domain-containing protein, partial [Bacteroidota bacterium]